MGRCESGVAAKLVYMELISMKASPKPTPTHHPVRAPKDLVRSVLRRNRLTDQTSRGNCLLEDKFRHQCPPRLPCKGSALPTGFVPVTISCGSDVRTISNPKMTPNFQLLHYTTCLGQWPS